MTVLGITVVDALPGLIGGLLSGIVAGHYAARAEVSYQQRATAVTELRRLTLEVDRTFRTWIMWTGYESEWEDYQLQGFYEVAAKNDALASYYGVHSVWLSGKTRESVERIIRGFTDHNARLMEASSEDQHKRREAAGAARQWHDRDLPELIDNLQALPRWRRIFGG